jgi:hypothetical protein
LLRGISPPPRLLGHPHLTIPNIMIVAGAVERDLAYHLKVIFPAINLDIVLCVRFAIKLDTLQQNDIIGLIMHIKVILLILLPTSHLLTWPPILLGIMIPGPLII